MAHVSRSPILRLKLGSQNSTLVNISISGLSHLTDITVVFGGQGTGPRPRSIIVRDRRVVKPRNSYPCVSVEQAPCWSLRKEEPPDEVESAPALMEVIVSLGRHLLSPVGAAVSPQASSIVPPCGLGE